MDTLQQGPVYGLYIPLPKRAFAGDTTWSLGEVVELWAAITEVRIL